MSSLYNAEALRPLSVFAPELRTLAVTVLAEPDQVGRLARKRPSEVILVPRRPNGDLLLVQRTLYPPGVFRLPTGGVEPGESPQATAARELWEECGYCVPAPGLLGVVEYVLTWPETAPLSYLSYVFVAEVPATPAPHPLDADEVGDYRWLAPGALGSLAEVLRNLDSGWNYWGRFRAAAYDFIQCGIMDYARMTRTG